MTAITPLTLENRNACDSPSARPCRCKQTCTVLELLRLCHNARLLEKCIKNDNIKNHFTNRGLLRQKSLSHTANFVHPSSFSQIDVALLSRVDGTLLVPITLYSRKCWHQISGKVSRIVGLTGSLDTCRHIPTKVAKGLTKVAS